jgi:hypothetical protein
MFDLQDAERAIRLDFEPEAVVASAEPKVGRSFQPLHVAFTVHAVSGQDVQDLDRLFAINPA